MQGNASPSTHPSGSPPPPPHTGQPPAGPSPAAAPPAAAPPPAAHGSNHQVGLAAVLIAVVGVVSGLVTVGDYGPFATTFQKSLAIIGTLLLVLFVWVLIRIREGIGPALGWGSVGAILTLFTLVLGTAGLLTYQLAGNDEDVLVKGLTVTFPSDGQHVKACTSVKGAGRIPQGYELWIFVGIDESDGSTEFWVTEPARTDGDDSHWKAPFVGVGDEKSNGVSAQLYAVLVPAPWGEYLKDSNGRGSFWASRLPPGAQAGPAVTVVRDADPKLLGCK